jgi:hypothetical protein
MALNFPNSPSLNDTYTEGGRAWQFNGTAWDAVNTAVGVGSWIYGTGGDGSVTISSGTTNLTRDMDYSSLTISGTGVLDTNGFKVRVSGTLDLSVAPAGAIINNGANGGNASGTTAGTATAQPDNQWTTVPKCGMSNAGASGSPAPGSTGPLAASYVNYGGANGGQSGAGGAGSNAGGAGSRAVNGLTIQYNLEGPLPVIAWNSNNYEPSTAFAGSIGAGGGSGGGNSSSAQGGGGGAGGTSGGCIYIAANTIARGNNATASIISADGGNGGNGGNANGSGNAGGGGGGAGGGGGTVMVVYTIFTGSTITNAIDVTGGNGGNGGTAIGTGTAGAGGGNGGAGNVLIINSNTGTVSITRATDGATAQTVGTTAGKTATTTRVNL